MSAFICPSCGHALHDRPDPHKLLEHLPIVGVRRALLRVLVANFAREVPAPLLRDRIYSGCIDGGPLGASNCVRTSVYQLRKLLEPYGLTILGRAFHPGSYRLDWIDAPALHGGKPGPTVKRRKIKPKPRPKPLPAERFAGGDEDAA